MEDKNPNQNPTQMNTGTQQPNIAKPNVASPNPILAQSPQPAGENNKMILWLIVGVIIVIVSVGGIYFYMSSQQAKVTKTPALAPKTESVGSLESEVNAIEVDDVEKEFETVDKDLQSL